MLVELTNETLEIGATLKNGYNYDQLRVLGVSIPPVSGWKRALIGKSIHEDTYSLYMKLKGLKKNARKQYKEEIERICKMEHLQ